MNIFIGTRLELEPEVPLATEQKLVGAFKGGFTAGFENTVGSAQGWAPRQFISGRKGADYSQPQRITDFMDHEDMEEFGAKKIMEEDFESLGSTAKELERRKLMASGLSSVDDLITYENPIGEEILRRLLAETPTKKIPKIGTLALM